MPINDYTVRDQAGRPMDAGQLPTSSSQEPEPSAATTQFTYDNNAGHV